MRFSSRPEVLSYVVITSLALSSTPLVAWVTESLTPGNFGSVRVVVEDMATGGCWTNLGEAQTYAEDKLGTIGYRVEEQTRGMFIVQVHAERTDAGKCYGRIYSAMLLSAGEKGMRGELELSRVNSIFTNYPNANTLTLDLIKAHIDQLAAVLPR
jgi:hypothetical protein